MHIEVINEPFPHAIIKDVYDQNELNLIWQELDFLTYKDKVVSTEEMGVAYDFLSCQKKANNTGFNLDEIFPIRKISNILTLNRKIFNRDLAHQLSNVHPLYTGFKLVNYDTTKIRYYDNNEEYESHFDTSNYTVCTYFYKDRSKIKGGDLQFPSYEYKIKTENNMAIFFCGHIEHKATKAERLDDWKPFDGYGRYCMNQFCSLMDKRNV